MIQITQTYTFESDMGRITNPAVLTEFIDLISFFFTRKSSPAVLQNTNTAV